MLSPDHETAASRREFLAGLATVLVAAMPAACRRPDDPKPAIDVAPSDGPRVRRPPLPDREPLMRVRVLRVRGEPAEARLGDPDQALLVEPGAQAGGVRNAAVGPLVVTLGAGGWSVTEAGGRNVPLEGTEPLTVSVAAGGAEAVLRLGQRPYPGAMRLVARTDTDAAAFDVVNLVPMEAYLPGVVAGELFAHWKLQTRAAQAVAARSFAACEHAWFRARRGHDVTNTADSQVYQGRVEHPDTLKAVAMTRGAVLACDGSLVPGYYSSCCGGLAARAADAIGPSPINDVPPLDGRDGRDVCTGTMMGRWTVKRPAGELAARLAGWGRRNGEAGLAALEAVTAVEVVERNRHGRPTRYAVIDGHGGRDYREILDWYYPGAQIVTAY